MSIKIIIFIAFILGLAYIFFPGPDSIDDFPPIPNSIKSNEPGDTYQNPNIAAYFSDFDRENITSFYKNAFKDLSFGSFLPPFTLNYPPEFARQMVRSEQVTTFLEEYVYPLRGSIFVNGYEPLVENEIKKRSHNFVGDHIHINGRYFVSKTTLRFYPADYLGRLVVYTGIWLSAFAIYEVGRKALKEA